jgi:hypothetical protein
MQKLALAPAIIAVLASPVFLSHGSARQVPKPTAWVAFDANFVRNEPGVRRVVGWFHRGADGSTREESNADGPSRPLVLIMNVAKRLQYRFENEAWNSYLVNLPPGGFLPETVDRDPRKFTPAPAIEKIEVFRFVNPQGVVLFVAPGLNDFPLRSEGPNGEREIFSNVLIRDQPAGLFEPPPGSAVAAHLYGASGAIYYPAGGNPQAK